MPLLDRSNAFITELFCSIDFLTRSLYDFSTLGRYARFDQNELPSAALLNTDDTLIRHPIRGKNGFISHEQPVSHLHCQFKVHGHVKRLAGPRSRFCVPWMGGDEMIAHPGPSTWNEAILESDGTRHSCHTNDKSPEEMS